MSRVLGAPQWPGCSAPDPGSGHACCRRVKVHRNRKGERRSFAKTDYITMIDAAHQYLKAPIVIEYQADRGNFAQQPEHLRRPGNDEQAPPPPGKRSRASRQRTPKQ